MSVFRIDPAVPLAFLRALFEADDWIAVLVKSSERATQRILPVTSVLHPRLQAWLRAQNAARHNVYVSVNAVTPGQHSRRRDAIRAVRHLFLDADVQAGRVLQAIARRQDVPAPSCVVRSSRGRAQLLWRVAGFTATDVESVQKRLARELGTDPAATSSAQMMRLPGFLNHKYVPGHMVSADYHDIERRFRPSDFGSVAPPPEPTDHARSAPAPRSRANAVTRARGFVASTPPAVVGRHGDVQTFRLCCRLVRGFALSDDEALEVLAPWNARCEPPWSDRELRAKLRNARRYGREQVAGLLEAR